MSGGMGMNGMGHGMGNPHNQGRMMGNQMISGMGQQMGHPGMMAPMGQMGHPQHQGHPQQVQITSFLIALVICLIMLIINSRWVG